MEIPGRRWSQRKIGATKLCRRGQYKEDVKITVDGVPMRVQKCMGVDKRRTSSPAVSTVSSFAVVIPVKHASCETAGELPRKNFLPCRGYLLRTAIFIVPVARHTCSRRVRTCAANLSAICIPMSVIDVSDCPLTFPQFFPALTSLPGIPGIGNRHYPVVETMCRRAQFTVSRFSTRARNSSRLPRA